MRQPQTIWSLCAFIFGLMGIIFVFLGMLFYITDIPVNGGLQLVFYPNWGDPFIGQYCLFGEVRSAGAAQKAPKNKRHFSGRKNSIRSTSSLDQLEHKDICKLARAMLSVGRSMLLLLWRTDLYSQKPLVMDKAGY